jgi:hypothetical protein
MEAILSALKGALLLCAQLFIIIVPLTMFYEFLKTRQVLVADKRRGMVGISAKGLIPLATGIIIGITYGAGVIIHSIRSSDIKKGEAFLILLYLSVCHAIIEDTLIFVVIGANGVILLATRFFLATVLTYGSYKMGLFQRDSREFPEAGGSSKPNPPV